MNSIQTTEIGELIRKKRREQGLRLEDLADENISPATISNIERGVPYVHQEKIHYVLSKLQLNPEDLPKLLLGEQQSMERLKFQLDSIETLLEFGQKKTPQQKLKELEIPDSHPFAARVRYLQGKSHLLTGSLKRSDRMFSNAIRLERQHDEPPQSNLEACSYHELSRSAIRQNLPEKALEYTYLGLKAFNPDGERQQIKYFLEVNRAGILLQLNRFGESLQLIDKLWKERSQIQPTRVLIELYLLRMQLLQTTRMYQQAVVCAQEGWKSPGSTKILWAPLNCGPHWETSIRRDKTGLKRNSVWNWLFNWIRLWITRNICFTYTINWALCIFGGKNGNQQKRSWNKPFAWESQV